MTTYDVPLTLPYEPVEKVVFLNDLNLSDLRRRLVEICEQPLRVSETICVRTNHPVKRSYLPGHSENDTSQGHCVRTSTHTQTQTIIHERATCAEITAISR